MCEWVLWRPHIFPSFQEPALRRRQNLRGEKLHQRERRLYLINQDLLTGEMCCFDVSFPNEWRKENASWTKKCCDNPTGLPVITPHQNITTQGLKEVGFLAKLPPIYSVSAGQGPHLSCPIFP